MYFKLKKLSMDMGDTPVENIFINDYMPAADGNFVKVYLIGYKLARESGGLKNFDFHTVADILGLIESDVLRAWDYWEKVGIIKKELQEDGSFDIVFLSLKELYVENIYTVSNAEEKVDQNSILDDKKIAGLLSSADYFMRGRLSIAQKQDIASWRDVYNMPVEIIEEAFWYATEVKKKDSIQYVEAIVRNWSKNNIRTVEDIENSYREHDERYYRLIKIKDKIGLSNKSYNAVDFETVNSWFEKYNISMELVMAACEKCINTNNPNLGYVNRILLNWVEKGITSPDQIKSLDKRETKVKKTKFHNFKQLTDKLSEDDLEELARKKRQAYYKSLR
ncbi:MULTISPECIES: DnaD domain-containing protein [Peptoniphilus]|uniref:DnaD domain-containing protein n=1 Tax=Peptoniphilus TaxID=162289 RepID=UPI0001DAA0D7|nr:MULTISPECIES: DnaD domain protein [Peptoniphilus]EFI41662.1 DnaD domain protein [Peptoniphilus sp. oral taxon 386 str. F0131]